eukprot:TRINITY_DN2051_c0_g1_i1.p1 TRINITY_DN2051_c0_g1~~TRINITY_DN2051_c0_g1_i1.p1  ORF type:complete len:355 (-),score=98.85 TRINITY_DN2051_c0_g1_i1:1322-2386(-)
MNLGDGTLSLFLLGCVRAGKSVLYKQIRQSFTPSAVTNREVYRNVLSGNLLHCFQILRSLVRSNTKLYLDLVLPENVPSLESIADIKVETEYGLPMTPEMSSSFRKLWEDPGIQKAYLDHRVCGESKCAVLESLEFMMNILVTTGGSFPSPELTFEECLRAYHSSFGRYVLEVEVNGLSLKLIDVGGSSRSRKFWNRAKSQNTAVLYCVNVGNYNLHLWDAPTTKEKYMDVSKKLLKKAVRLMPKEAPLFLAFMGQDLMEEKLTRFKCLLSDMYPEYKGDDSVPDMVKFIQDLHTDAIGDRPIAGTFVLNSAFNSTEVDQMMKQIEKALATANWFMSIKSVDEANSSRDVEEIG